MTRLRRLLLKKRIVVGVTTNGITFVVINGRVSKNDESVVREVIQELFDDIAKRTLHG